MTGAVLAVLALTASAADRALTPALDQVIQAGPGFDGPDASEVDILKPFPGYPRLYVQARMPDGELGLFLVDTGADISVLSRKTAERLALDVQENFTTVWGLSGTAPMNRAVIPEIVLGEMRIPDVEVAVGVRGVEDEIGFMPLDGILGNNVWSRFTVEIDYPAELLVLHDPYVRAGPRRGTPLQFDGAHIFTVGRLTAEKDGVQAEQVLVSQLDTGAGGVILCGSAGEPFAGLATEGIESLIGVGASETMPPYRFYRTTRRVPLDTLELGGREQKIAPTTARWFGFSAEEAGQCSFDALIGHELFAGYRMWIDYADGRFALKKSRRPKRSRNGHQVIYDQEIAAHGEDPTRDLFRARLLIGADRLDDARPLLEGYIGRDADDAAEARVLLAQVERSDGDLAGAWSALDGVAPGELVDEGEIVRSVNGLLLDGHTDQALALAGAATEQRPEDGWSHVALADALLLAGRPDEATASLRRAAALAEYPDAHLLRRARIALASGDRYGAMADMRELLQLYPGEGLFIWFYAMLVETEEDRPTFAADLQAAMDRLHPALRPLDFLVAGYHAVGDDAAADMALAEGVERDCEPVPDGSARDNCFAWYWALRGIRLDESRDLIEAALAETGDRSDYLDTRAMVYLARGELLEAADSARRAARLDPDDAYMLWQAERLQEMAAGQR